MKFTTKFINVRLGRYISVILYLAYCEVFVTMTVCKVANFSTSHICLNKLQNDQNDVD